MFVNLVVKKWAVSVCIGVLLLFFSNSVFPQCTPVINYTTTTGTLKGCSPFNVSFTDPNNSFARTWDFGDSTPTSGSKTPFHTFKQGVLGDTTYVVSLFKACGVGATSKVTVTVYAVPKVDFTIDTNQVCAIYDFVHFKRVSDPGTYTWDFGDNTSSTNANPSHSYGAGGLYDVSLKVKNLNGCEFTKIYSELITVNSLPSPDFILDNYSGCAPFNVQISNKTDTSVVKIKYWSWDYDNGDPLDSIVSPGVVSFKVPGTKQMSLTTTL
jgi:PKD repeat protein